MSVCAKCGLPQDLCVCESIAKETQKITIREEKRAFRRAYTIIEGIDSREINLKDLTKKLKDKLACGGSTKEGRIELQGTHKQKVKKILIDAGFAPETVVVKEGTSPSKKRR